MPNLSFSVSGDPDDVDGVSKLLVPPRSRVKMTIEIEVENLTDSDGPDGNRYFNVGGRVRKLSVLSVRGPGGVDARHEQLNDDLMSLLPVRTMGTMG